MPRTPLAYKYKGFQIIYKLCKISFQGKVESRCIYQEKQMSQKQKYKTAVYKKQALNYVMSQIPFFSKWQVGYTLSVITSLLKTNTFVS